MLLRLLISYRRLENQDPEDIDVNTDEWSQASREKKVEAGHPTRNLCALLQTLLSKLPEEQVSLLTLRDISC